MSLAKKLESELLRYIKSLDNVNKGKVLNFIEGLIVSEKKKHANVMKLAGSVSNNDADQMERAIEEACEKVDLDGWK